MPRLTLRFYEVEHSGDLDPILEDVTASGGTVLSTSIEDDDEAVVVIEVANVADFKTAFRKTKGSGWLD